MTRFLHSDPLAGPSGSAIFSSVPQRLADLCHRTSPSDAFSPPADEQHSGGEYVPYRMESSNETAPVVPVEYLAERLDPDFGTGFLWWKAGPMRGKRGFTAVTHNGYYVGCTAWGGKKRALYAHRVIWALAHGDWPRFGIDHIDGNGLNNSLTNLRDVPHAENMKNRKLHKSSGSGILGISESYNGKWRVRAPLKDGRTASVGTFATLEQAIAARDAAYASLGFHPNHGKR